MKRRKPDLLLAFAVALMVAPSVLAVALIVHRGF
jgi:hypothetical protein